MTKEAEVAGELLPCPFCGKDAERVIRNNRGWIGCGECDIGTAFNPPFGNRELATWNARAARPADEVEAAHKKGLHWKFVTDATDTACGRTAVGLRTSLLTDFVDCPDCDNAIAGYRHARAQMSAQVEELKRQLSERLAEWQVVAERAAEKIDIYTDDAEAPTQQEYREQIAAIILAELDNKEQRGQSKT